MTTAQQLRTRLPQTAFAFRGYNVTNLGRTAELLAHPVYGTVVGRYLARASAVCSSVLGRRVDLVRRVEEGRESTLDTFGEDIGLIMSVELAQVELLRDYFGLDYTACRVGLGYSLGEVTALCASGVYQMEDVLLPLVTLAPDCAALARDITMGVVFSRGVELDLDRVRHLCLEINLQGRGVIAISSHLSPNTVLVLGQQDTVDRFKRRMGEVVGGHANLRKNRDRWPPLHTPILWERHVPNRAGMMMHTVPGGMQPPDPPVLSLVTGDAGYTAYNSRDILHRWLDNHQRLWEVINELLQGGINLVLHVGPDPNLLPATFKRLSDNVRLQLAGGTLNSLGLRAVSGLARRAWLAKLLSAKAALLRAPFVEHVIVEDWLLAQRV
jgi:[acyl-carrier-protein] S-malonyltransferase